MEEAPTKGAVGRQTVVRLGSGSFARAGTQWRKGAADRLRVGVAARPRDCDAGRRACRHAAAHELAAVAPKELSGDTTAELEEAVGARRGLEWLRIFDTGGTEMVEFSLWQELWSLAPALPPQILQRVATTVKPPQERQQAETHRSD